MINLHVQEDGLVTLSVPSDRADATRDWLSAPKQGATIDFDYYSEFFGHHSFVITSISPTLLSLIESTIAQRDYDAEFNAAQELHFGQYGY